MGYRLAKKVRQEWGPHLNDHPYRLLVEIALTIPDDGPRRCWFERRRYAEMMGRTSGEAKDLLAAKRALGALQKAGALVEVQHAHHGRTTIYQLVVPSDPTPPEGPTKGVTLGVTLAVGLEGSDSPERGSGRGSLSDREGGHSVTPLGRSEEKGTSPLSFNSPEEGLVVRRTSPEVCSSLAAEALERRRRKTRTSPAPTPAAPEPDDAPPPPEDTHEEHTRMYHEPDYRDLPQDDTEPLDRDEEELLHDRASYHRPNPNRPARPLPAVLAKALTGTWTAAAPPTPTAAALDSTPAPPAAAQEPRQREPLVDQWGPVPDSPVKDPWDGPDLWDTPDVPNPHHNTRGAEPR